MLEVLALLVALTPPEPIDMLMVDLSKMPGLEAEFVETKHIALLAAPLTTKGVIRFASPDMLVRETNHPHESRVLIHKDLLFFDDGKKSQEVNVGGNPVVRTFVNSFVLLLAGDLQALEEIFTIAYAPTREEGWKLTLRPKKAPIDKIIKTMELEGVGVSVKKLVILEATGDRTETSFKKVNTKRSFSASEKKTLFRVP